jgi:hypothetical protein
MRGSSICLLFKDADQENKSKNFSPAITDATHESLLNKCSNLLTKASNKAQEKLPHAKEYV